jgi:glutamate synthase (ferredoxin)
MVSLQELRDKYDIAELREILEDYEKETGSELAAEILADFDSSVKDFKKIVPNDYARMLDAIGKYEKQGISHENAMLEAFEDVTA